MKRPPRDPKEPILGRKQWFEIATQSLTLAAGTFGALALARFWLQLDSSAVITVTFLTLAFAELWHVFNMRIARSDLWKNEVSQNPWVWGSLVLCSALLLIAIYVPPLAQVLGLIRPDLTMWIVVFGMSVAPFMAGQVVAMILKTLEGRITSIISEILLLLTVAAPCSQSPLGSATFFRNGPHVRAVRSRQGATAQRIVVHHSYRSSPF